MFGIYGAKFVSDFFFHLSDFYKGLMKLYMYFKIYFVVLMLHNLTTARFLMNKKEINTNLKMKYVIKRRNNNTKCIKWQGIRPKAIITIQNYAGPLNVQINNICQSRYNMWNNRKRWHHRNVNCAASFRLLRFQISLSKGGISIWCLVW